MSKLLINIILPFPVTKPVGGAKIMYEYANRLQAKGHDVFIYHSIKRPFKKSNTPVFIKQLIFFFRNVTRPNWFKLSKNIVCKIVPEISNKTVRNADIVFSTWWQMTYAVKELSESKGKKFNLIQDYENWSGNKQAVDNSFTLPIQHMVISNYLQQLVMQKTGVLPFHLPNAIDTNIFYKAQNVSEEKAHTLIMLYSTEQRKGTQYGMEAIALLQKKFSKLKVILFGVPPAPPDLPEYITYYQKPSNLNELYNQAAIFCSPSLGEGWALPPAEAMACGCAVVCTNIGGHWDYAINNETALLVEPTNVTQMVDKISLLLLDDDKRNKLAQNGYELITTKFSWEISTNNLQTQFYTALNA
jgi:glycosyltransferase involved in cell wall biosynthesis